MKKNLEKNRKVEKQTESVEYLLYRKIQMLGIPQKAFIEITYKCNFRCLHCYLLGLSPKGKKEMTTDEIFSVIDQLADIGIFFLGITGGEPLIRPDFMRIMEYARKRDFVVSLNTNASLVTKDIAQRLAGLFLKGVNVSIYGMSEHVYKAITGASGAFKKVVRGIELLVESGLNVTVKIVLLRENFSQLESFEKFIKKIGVKHEITWKNYPRLDGSCVPLRHEPTSSQIEKFLYLHPDKCKPQHDPIPPPSELLCWDSSVIINPYGEVKPCILIENHTNIRDKSIAEILKRDPLFKRMNNLCWKHLPAQCKSCQAFSYCKPCPGALFLETGKLMPSVSPKIMCKGSLIMKKMHERFKNDPSAFKISR